MIRTTTITGEPVLFAPERNERPDVHEGVPCPFCPGAESETPPEICRDGDPWRVRVFPNKYPATEYHEVIVESARHDETFDQLGAGHAARAIEISFDRYRVLRAAAQYVCLFKNHGRAAGASIPHIHSQIIGTPFIPSRIAREAEAFERASSCTLCGLDDPLIDESEHYRWIAPRGATMAWQQWIFPKSHQHEMREPRELASLLQRSARGMLSISDSFNWAFINFPQQRRGHWYVDLFPRLTAVAGFELGSGTFINTVDAEEAARVLRRTVSRKA